MKTHIINTGTAKRKLLQPQARVRRATERIELISLTEYHEGQRDIADSTNDPNESFIRRVENLAAWIGVSEEQAERIILGKA